MYDVSYMYLRKPTSDLQFLKKMTSKSDSFPFSNFTFQTDYYRNIWNKEILCSQEYLLISRFTNVGTDLLIVISGGWAVQA